MIKGHQRLIQTELMGPQEIKDSKKVKLAAEKIYDWVKTSDSPLKALVHILSSGGLFYVGQVHEKCSRAYVQE